MSPKLEDLVVLKELIEAGKITPVMDRTYPLSETPQAIGHVGEGHARGKVAITVTQVPRLKQRGQRNTTKEKEKHDLYQLAAVLPDSGRSLDTTSSVSGAGGGEGTGSDVILVAGAPGGDALARCRDCPGR